MAITRSSRAITSTRRASARRLCCQLGLAAALSVAVGGAAPAVKAPDPTPAAAKETGGPSFFEPFDRLDTRRWFVSDGWVNGDYQGCAWSRANIGISKGVLTMVLGKANDKLRPYRCVEVRTVEHLGYGTYEARVRTVAGSGLNTAFFTYSNESRDEIDFEFLGKDSSTVQLNYYKTGRGGHETWPKVGSDAAAGFNTYAFVWSPDRIRWYINGKFVREATGADVPQVPGSMILSIWNGTPAVAGWLGNFDASRTPVFAEFDWVAFTRAGESCRFPESITCHPL